MTPLDVLVLGALQRAGVAVTGIQIRDGAQKSTWKVQPSALQDAAQPVIDAFSPEAPEILAAERDALMASEAGREIVKALLLFYLRDKLGRNPTVAERDAARTAFLQAYRDVS